MAGLADEFRHQPGHEPHWNESWRFDVVAPDGSWGLHVQLTLFPNARRARWWSVIARRDERLLLVGDDALDAPRDPSFEVRGPGLWADLHCHRPMQRWQVNFEGVTVALDDPAEAHGSARGAIVPVEFEFEWESAAPAVDRTDGYTQRCSVVGDAEIRGSAALALAHPAPGFRSRTWGVDGQ